MRRCRPCLRPTLPHPRPGGRRQAARGFTLIEVLVAVLIVGVLLAVAFPSYQDSIRKGRRADAFAALTALQQAQERHRANRSTYASALSPDDTPANPDALPRTPATSPNGHYTLAINEATAGGYTATATAAGGQAADTACTRLVVRAVGGRVLHGSSSSDAAIDWSSPTAADPGRCWVK